MDKHWILVTNWDKYSKIADVIQHEDLNVVAWENNVRRNVIPTASLAL